MTNYLLSNDDIRTLIDNLGARRVRENEVLELKEAKEDFSFKDLARYFSALSNEANLRDVGVALLLFGVRDDGSVCGTRYRQDSPGKLQSLKREIAGKTNQRMTFREISELEVDGRRVVAFQIPPALNGMPTTWENVAWGREGSSLVPLSLDKIDAIRAQPRAEWAREAVPDADMGDLDPEAVDYAHRAFQERFYSSRPALLDGLSTVDLLDKMGVTRGGLVTNAALMLLGKEGSEALIDGPAPLITWTLYGAEGRPVSYRHYGPPLLLGIDEAARRIRNERVPIMGSASPVVPQTVAQYDSWSVRELLGNAIAHQDYGLSRRMYLNEFSDRLVFVNEGAFIPGSVDRVLEAGYHAPRYRNPFLCDALTRMGVLDQNTLGIRRVFMNQRDRRMPLPTYDLSMPDRVSVTLWGVELDARYTQALGGSSVTLEDAVVLDAVQKRLPVDMRTADRLVARGLLVREGESFALAAAPQVEGVAAVGSGSQPHAAQRPSRFEAVADVLVRGPQGRSRILAELENAGLLNLFGADPVRGVSSTLQAMRKEGLVESSGSTKAAVWHLVP